MLATFETQLAKHGFELLHIVFSGRGILTQTSSSTFKTRNKNVFSLPCSQIPAGFSRLRLSRNDMCISKGFTTTRVSCVVLQTRAGTKVLQLWSKFVASRSDWLEFDPADESGSRLGCQLKRWRLFHDTDGAGYNNADKKQYGYNCTLILRKALLLLIFLFYH